MVEHVLNKRFRKNHNSFLKIIEHLAQKNNKCNKKDSTTLQNCGFKVAPLAMNQIFLLRSNQKFKDFFFFQKTPSSELEINSGATFFIKAPYFRTNLEVEV